MPNKVIKRFQDKETNNVYSKGDLYTSESAERISFLVDEGYLDEAEVKGEEVKAEYPKHTGGGWFELSNGEKVQGKEEAAAAQEELDKEGE
jgi:hypothetical protein